MFKRAIVCLVAFFVLAAMLLRLPSEAALIRALDVDMTLVEMCDDGDEKACDMLQSEESFQTRVCGETKQVQGTCLYVTEKGIAVRAQGGKVTDVSIRAALLEG